MPLTLGPRLIYVPICHSAPYPQQGPAGYELVDKVTECPIVVRAESEERDG